MFPIRCISCGRPIAQHWEVYKKRVSDNEDPKKILDELGVRSFCCRNAFLTHVELIQETAKFKR
ncbi:MAG: DNA-directed RNA polymerase subunit N [Candidatus Aenigmarchaeota archaeon]|nr:DNA-directed RNA polymerase subunit N [Candidatus Aenigmarchaeota archaeon]